MGDEGFEGPDCSLRSCPTGDNVDSDGIYEVQVFTCARVKDNVTDFFNSTSNQFEYADDAAVSFTFRSCTSDAILYSASEGTVESALEKMECITDVVVSFSGDNLCGDGEGDANTLTVTFIAVPAARNEQTDQDAMLADLPQMIIQEEQSSSDLDPYVALSSTTLQDSTRENDVCSSRGV